MWSKKATILIILILIFSYGLNFNFVFGDEIQIPTSLTPVDELRNKITQIQENRDKSFAETSRLLQLKESAENSLTEARAKGNETLIKLYGDQVKDIENRSARLTEDIANYSKQISETNQEIDKTIEELKKNPYIGDYNQSQFAPGLHSPVGDQNITYDSRINLPGLINSGVRNDFVSFLKWLFPFMLSVAAILAVLMIVIAGTRWVASAGSEAEIKAARDMITNAILGLILAFAAWLIIQTINPDILKGLL